MSVIGDKLAKAFLTHREAARELIGRLPDGGVDFRPWDGAMTTGEQIKHMGGAHHLMMTIATGGGVQRPDPASLPNDLPGIRSWLDAMTEADAATLRGLSEEQLAADQEGFRSIVQPASGWVARAREHEIHHKGLLFAYARLQGVEPPNWLKV